MNNLSITIVLIIITYLFIRRQRSLMKNKIKDCKEQSKTVKFASNQEQDQWIKNCIGI
tara:strand:+ start:774 stop:947 length:174 start_codon:yes stop_codon:yes gene_type:complete